MSNKAILEVTNLSLVFNEGKKNEVIAVNDISFKINRGETFGLVGESGSGKTTTGRMVSKSLTPNKGKITFKGDDISNLNKSQENKLFHKNVQMIFQDPYASLDPRKKIIDIIGEGLKIHKMVSNQSELKKRVTELLKQVGLNEDHMYRYPKEFSGGQRQRIGIARALAVEPELIIADEPISALDVSIQGQIVNLLKDLQDELGLTYLFIAHDLTMVNFMSDTIGVMYKGNIVEIGESNEVYKNPLHPYTKQLISAIPLPYPNDNKQEDVSAEKYNFNGDEAMHKVKDNHFIYCTESELEKIIV